MTQKLFTEFDLVPDLLKGLEKMGYTHATPVQEVSIPKVQTGKDLMVQARTGTGKTLGFGLPTLQKIDPQNPDTQVLVICPTRELALQVSDELARVAESMQIIVAAVFGGVKIETQIDKMQWAPVVVGTPGRLRDHIERGYLHLDTCKVVVLDEADEMLDMGFKDDLEFILKKVPAEQRQTLLFSATFPSEITKIAHKYMRDPEKLEVSSGYTPAVGLTHKFARVPKDKKIQALGTLLRGPEMVSSIIFCETKVEAAWVFQRLKREGLLIGILTGDIPQERRLVTLQAFRDNEINILVATDVAARGLDIPAVSHVFHFTVPRDTATYVHRSGRTARAGKKGTAFTLVTTEEERDFQRIMKDIKQNQQAAAGGGEKAEARAPREERGGREGGRDRDRQPVAAGDRPERAPREERGDRNGRDRNDRGPRDENRGERGDRGPRPGQPEGGRQRLSSALYGTAQDIFRSIAADGGDTETYRNLTDALLAHRDARRVVAALLAQASQAENWADAVQADLRAVVAPPAAASDDEDGEELEAPGEGREGREGGRRRRRGGRGRGGRDRDRGDRAEGSDEPAAERAPREEAAPAPTRTRTTRPVSAAAAEEAAPAPTRTRSTRPAVAAAPAAEPAPAPTRTRSTRPAAAAPAAEEPAAPAKSRSTKKVAEAPAPVVEEAPAKKARTTKKAAEAPAAVVEEAPAKKPRATKKAAEAPAAVVEEAPAKKARTTKKAAEAPAPAAEEPAKKPRASRAKKPAEVG